jgi:hypothetical protein
MPLIQCPACNRQISTEAVACPQCGHPNRSMARDSAAPECYACSSPATTRCQSCGNLSCALHLQSIFVRYGRGGSYELRCESCYASARYWQMISWGIVALIGIGILVALMSH